ncbi:ORF MSV026 ALI motif gene family protein [Melanoplus sanguinipes entomopoxvirus]|uniref:ORF MSV026 ALI motif gene family protein n=1 Tax=Melanoplus sanguinipes entomopoxvirus TaxID=83191 RepID=Q9YW67_MSEPV|nr:ORF MSV026 ALI motif gene family protein [Melanoplus sanguinipes entomopoxvirus]AAC97846.1 ORF MSV026 ALI motif gene family protein [Melanoplus sanguinipes entomopoxvirus 'O']
MDIISNIKTINVNNCLYFKGEDCAKILKYKNTYGAIRNNVSKNNKIKFEKNNDIYINKLGLSELIIKHKSIVSTNTINTLIHNFNLNLDLFEKKKYIDIIISCFRNHRYKENYIIDEFCIDLYFIDHNIAVEYCNDNHINENKLYYNYRYHIINKYLNCIFIKFNPKSVDFNIYYVINQIHNNILNNILH